MGTLPCTCIVCVNPWYTGQYAVMYPPHHGEGQVRAQVPRLRWFSSGAVLSRGTQPRAMCGLVVVQTTNTTDDHDESTFYNILGVASSASEQEINTNFQILVRKLHPDRPEGIEAFKSLAAAAGVLRQPGRRRAYDFWLKLSAIERCSCTSMPCRNAPGPCAAFLGSR